MSNEKDKETIKIKFIFGKESRVVEACVGQTVLEVAEKNEIPLYGACEGNGACGTCHVIFEEKDFKKLSEPNECEEDVLDRVPELTHFSRLGCQIRLTKNLNGMVVRIPKQNRNFARG